MCTAVSDKIPADKLMSAVLPKYAHGRYALPHIVLILCVSQSTSR